MRGLGLYRSNTWRVWCRTRVDVLAQPAGAADEQRGRASASGLGDQAQVVVLHSLGAGHAVLGNHHVNGADLRDAGSLHF